jgi:hypothetical protein
MPASQIYGESPEELRKTQLIEYLRRVIHAVEERTAGEQAPLVLVAQPEIQGHVRALAKTLSLVEGGVELDPEALEEGELHRHAYELVRPIFASGREREMERFTSLLGAGDARAATVPEEIVKAARHGRVATLFVAKNERLWGRFDEANDRVVVHGSPTPEDEDLLDRAAIDTLLQGGRVEVVTREELPRPGLLMAAVLRY